MILHIGDKLVAHLGGDKRMGDTLCIEIIIEVRQVQADVITNDVNASTAGQRRVHIHHAGIETVAGVRSHAVSCSQAIVTLIPMAESHQVAVLQLTTLRCSRRTRGIKHDE